LFFFSLSFPHSAPSAFAIAKFQHSYGPFVSFLFCFYFCFLLFYAGLSFSIIAFNFLQP